MGKYLSKPNTSKQSSGRLTTDFHWGATSMQGWRSSMQNAYTCEPNLGNLRTFGLFMVCDGYGGCLCAEKTAKEFPEFLLTQEPFSLLSDGDEYDKEQVRGAIIDAFLNFDKTLRTSPNMEEMGCTATGVLTTPKHFFVFNLGHSRTVIQRQKKIIFATQDHKPYLPNERIRIEKAGGKIVRCRVNGRLNISRSLGNLAMKKNTDCNWSDQMVSSAPDVNVIERSKDEDEFIAIYCNGIADPMTDEEILRFCNTRMPYKARLKDLCEELVDFCCHRDAKNNMSVIMLKFNNENKPADFDKMTQDEILDDKIRSITAEYVERAFRDRGSAYGWQVCFDKLNNIYGQSIFDQAQHTQGYGIDLKKGVIFKEFDELTTSIRDARRYEAYKALSHPPDNK